MQDDGKEMTRYAYRVEQCPFGRLERRWKNNIKMDLRKIGCEDERLVSRLRY
jgi:hypothetical protein